MHGHRVIKVVAGVVCVAILVVVAFVVHTFHGGNIQRARQIAVRLQTAAMANPSPGGAASPSGTTNGNATGVAAATTAPAAAANGARASAGAQSTTAAPSTAASKSVAPTSSAPAKAAPATGARPVVQGAPAASATAPRRQPTSAEVAQAIVAVHDLLPFFTPSADQIASVGNQVCSALDQGTPFAQVKSQALDMVGAGSISWMIPSSVPEVAIRTVVALYCPADAAKLH